MNKVQDIAVPQWNALSSQHHLHPHQTHPQHHQQHQLNTRIRGNNNELKPPMPDNFENEDQRRVSKISTGPMG